MSLASDDIIQIRDVTFTYLGEEAPSLREVNLNIRRGSFVLVLGPSGSGKSSLVNLLNGSIPHIFEGDMTGQVVVDGLDTRHEPVSRLATKVGLVFQDPDAQLVNVFVSDEVYFGPENLLMPIPEIEANTEMAVSMTDLRSLLDREVFHLSGGQKQRVALASVLSVRPDVVVLDQPTANLDPHTTVEVFRLLARLNREFGITVILVEQKVDDLAHLIDEVIVMKDGGIALQGPPREVFGSARARELGTWIPQVVEIADALADLVAVPQVPLTDTELAEHLQTGLAAVPPSVTFPVRPPAPAAAGAPLVEVRDLTFTYPAAEEPSLRNVNVTIRQGEFLAIIGRNGSGKSTLAKTLLKVNKAPDGRVFVGGQEINQLSLADLTSRLGYVFQNPDHQFVTDTVFDEVAYSLRARGRSEAEVEVKVMEALSLFDLQAFRDASPFSLSMGYRRLLSVATMLVVDQQLIILDEPTIGQDYTSCRRLLGFLRQLNEQGKAIVLITHDMRLISEWVGRVVVMSNSQVLLDGSVANLFADDRLLEAAALVRPPLVNVAGHLRRRFTGLPESLLTAADLRRTVEHALSQSGNGGRTGGSRLSVS